MVAFPRSRRRPWRLLLAGFGARGRQWAAAAGRRRDLEVVGVVDPAAAARAAAAARGLRVWPSLGEGLDAVRPDAAIVASPPAEHADGAVRCLESGAAVLVEKPLAPSLAAATRVAEAAARAGRPALVGQSFRFLRRSRAVARALRSGWIGLPRAATILSVRPSRATPPSVRDLEHGPLWDFAVHHVDLWLVHLAGPPCLVEATMRSAGGPDEPGSPAYAVRLRWPQGPVVVYCQRETPSGLFHHHEWIEGDRGALVVEDDSVRLVTPGRRPAPVRVRRRPSPEDGVLDELIAALAGRRSSPLAASANLGVIGVVEAAVRSIAAGRPVAPIGDARAERAGPAAGPRP